MNNDHKRGGLAGVYIVPGMPHLLLAPERSPGWQELADAYAKVRDEIAKTDAELIIYYSTQWLSVLGHMLQARPRLSGKLVDSNWHALGTMTYDFTLDQDFAHTGAEILSAGGYPCKAIDYEGFPVDSGTVVAANLLDPGGRLKAAMVSCNLYADYHENENLGALCAATLAKTGQRAIVVLVSSLSHRFHVEPIEPSRDHIATPAADAWNKRVLALLAAGKFAELVALAPEYTQAAAADMGFKGAAWLKGILGASQWQGEVLSYQPVWGTGAAVVSLHPALADARLTNTPSAPLSPALGSESGLSTSATMTSTNAPPAVGPYPHARRHGDLLFISGMGPRRAGQKTIPGVTLADDGLTVQSYDVVEQTHSVFANLKAILADAGSSLEQVIDVQVFLTDIKRDFALFNKAYGEYFSAANGPTRTTVEVARLPTPIAVELKVIASLR